MKDTLNEINALRDAGIIGQSAIGGAMGATFYLEPISTYDLDIFVLFDSPPLILTLTPISDFLRARGHQPEGDAISVCGWPVQFLPAESPLLREAVEQAVTVDFEGVELTQFMGWCVCSPTRAMLLTGRHPIRVGTAPETGGELDPAETTIAEGFKSNGYRTGVFGKWHNGSDPETPEFSAHFAEAFKHMPNKKAKFGHGFNVHGFDEGWVYYGGGPDHFTRRTVKGGGPVSWWHNREFRPDDKGYTDDLLTQHVLDFVRTSKEQPFFCYVPFQIAHGPLQAKDSDLAKIEPAMAAKLHASSDKVSPEEKRTHAAMLTALDGNVGSIVAELKSLGLIENTILVFTSDNGAMEAGSSLPLRGHKHTIYDGGVRLPTTIHWPKGGLVGGKKWNGLCGALDMFPTLMAMTDSKMPETRPLDGKNIWPALRDDKASPVESYYWVWRGSDAIRTSQWKLLRYFNRFELFDIRSDPNETKDVASENPEVIAMLKTKMDAWVDSIGVALTHQAPKKESKPAPEGEVLEVTVTVAGKPKPKDMIVVPFARKDGDMVATDHLEFDIAAAKDSPLKGFFYTLFDGNNAEQAKIAFKGGEGIDQFGREQITSPQPKGGAGVWEHRIIGLSSFCPGGPSGHAIAFKSVKPGTYKVYLDNLQIRHADGSTTPIWMSGKDTRKPKVAETEFFKDIQVRAVPVAEVGK